MKKWRNSCIVVFSLVLGFATSAQAWNDTGHEIVALLGYQKLADAKKQKRMLEILADHPHSGEYLRARSPDNNIDGERIAMNAGTWSDWVRNHHKKAFHQGTWHYINKPYIVASNKAKEKEIADAFNAVKNHGDILEVIPKAIATLEAPATTLEEKQNRAVMLCWLIHLTGDLHQPLHASALCTEASPKGDRGGNSIWVAVKKNQQPQKLHAVWDHMLGDHRDVRGIAREISDTVVVSDAQRSVLDPKAWANESLAIAKKNGYNFRGKRIKYVFDEDSDHNPPSAPELPKGYHIAGEEIARQRVAVAGARLAEILSKSLPD